jgi:hypothetical protein
MTKTTEKDEPRQATTIKCMLIGQKREEKFTPFGLDIFLG